MKKWLDNYNDYNVSTPEGMEGDGFSNVGRNSSPAWGGQFQMGGNIYPVNYVPQAQNGNIVPTEPINYLNSYIASPEFKKRFKGTDQEYKDSQILLNKAKKQYSPYVLNKEVKGDELGSRVSFPDMNKIYSLPKGTNIVLSKPQAVELNADLYNDVLPHEYSHTARKLGFMDELNFAFSNKDPKTQKLFIKWQEKNPNKSFSQFVKEKPINKHDTAPDENYSDLNSLRYLMNKQGIYDTRKGPMSKEDFNKALKDPFIKKQFNVKRLLKTFTPEQIIHLNNTVAENNIVQSENNIAQGGMSMPGAPGHMYARVGAPSKGPRRNQTDVTDASAQNGKEMQYYQNGLDFQPKTISKNGAWLDNYEEAQTGTKKFKLKDERELAYKTAESTNVKKKNFDLEQSKSNKSYINQLAEQQKENKRRKALTQDQREREDYNARNEERGSIQAPVKESKWDRTKAIVSNPLTAFGYAARNESLPTRFQHGERNTLDNAIDWINPLQGIAAASEIPGELSRGEYLNAGLSLLDAADLGVYAKGAMKASKPLLQKAGKALGTEEGLLSNAYKYNPWAFKPNPEAYYRGIGRTGLDDALESGYLRANNNKLYGEDVYMTPEFNMAKGQYSRNQPYSVGDRWGDDWKMVDPTDSKSYIAEIPKNKLTNPEVKGKLVTINKGPLPIDDVKLYKQDWWQGYKEVPKQEDGGIIKDDRGQWDHPGEITEINSNDITMEGVPYDVLGVSDTGDTKLMKPGKNYKFKGKKVTEYPMAKNGVNQQDQKTFEQLDQLTNFTNYNKPTIGGWLNKYN